MASLPSGFLTDAQRAALDAALAAKQQAAKTAAGGHHTTTAAHAGDKKPKNVKGSGGVKKGGAGGKFTWGNVLDEEGLSTLDKNDPNYDSEEEAAAAAVLQQPPQARRVKAEVEAYKEEINAIVEEYFESGDVGNVATSLEELGAPATMSHYFVKRLVTLALDRKDREREAASVLLSGLYADVISPEQMQKGFARLVDALEDTLLDVPDAVELLSLFIARAVVDDVLPPAAINKWCPPASGDASSASPAAAVAGKETGGGSPKKAAAAAGTAAPHSSDGVLRELRGRVEKHLSARHAAERLLRCWGTGASTSYADAKERVGVILAEYLSSHDAAEASRCLRALGLPFFHHELVKQGVYAGMGAAGQTPAVISLLKRLSTTGEITAPQLLKGFQRVSDNLPDTLLDNPAAWEQYQAVLDAAVADGLLDAATAAQLGPAGAAAAASAAAGGGAGTDRPASSASVVSNGAAGANGSPRGVGGACVPAFKSACITTLREYFDSSDAREVAARLLELGQPGLHPLFVKAAITLACDRKERERELVSTLLCELHPRVITGDQMASGFKRLLAAADDLVLDIPDALQLLSCFLGRAVVDEVLPPAFLAAAVPGLPDGGLGVTVVQHTGALLSTRHAAERLQNCWHGGGLSLEEVKGQLRAAVQEYLVAGGVEEVARVLKDLNMPHYHHELVKEAVEAGFEHPTKMPVVTQLLRDLSESGAISSTQMAQGLGRIRSRLADEALDAPGAPAAFEQLLQQAGKEGWLPAELGESSA